jgi:energy-coupling factor transport system ATP-binding protein
LTISRSAASSPTASTRGRTTPASAEIGLAEAAAGPPAETGAPAGRSGAGPPSIEAVDLGWTYAGRARPALAGLDFRVEPGRVLLVLGPSGSGKSTLARALAGLVPHTLPGRWQGSLRVGKLDVVSTPARFLGERVGLVFQDPDSQLVMDRVQDEVAFGLENRGWPRPLMQARVPEALRQVGLAGFELRATNTLSGGEKQRLAIADVLAAGPSLLVFDEPTANLDPPGMYETLAQIAALARRREHTIVLIEHRLEAALPLADEVLLLDDEGRQLAFAPAGSVRSEAVEMLERSGAWVPAAWQGRPSATRAEVPTAAEPASPASPGPAAEFSSDAGASSLASPAAPESPGAPGSRAGQPSGGPLLRAADVGVDYPVDRGIQRALDGFTLEVGAAERVAVVGPNGSGKSTLLFVLAGLRRPDRGSVGVRTLADRSSSEGFRDPARLSSAEIASRIGLVFQDPELGFVARTARDEVAATERAARRGGARAGRDEDGRDAGRPPDPDGVLARFGLGHLAEQDPFRLSQGEQRRLSLAALVLRPPAVLLLDEPTFGLDRRGTLAVMALLDELRRTGQAQVLATHDPRLLPRCDRVVALERGRLVFDGTPGDFLADPPYSPAEPWRDGSAAGIVIASPSAAVAR